MKTHTRRDFFKFIRDGSVALGVIGFLGIPRIENGEYPVELYKFENRKNIIDNKWAYSIAPDHSFVVWTEFENNIPVIYREQVSFEKSICALNDLYVWNCKEKKWYRIFTGISHLFVTET